MSSSTNVPGDVVRAIRAILDGKYDEVAVNVSDKVYLSHNDCPETQIVLHKVVELLYREDGFEGVGQLHPIIDPIGSEWATWIWFIKNRLHIRRKDNGSIVIDNPNQRMLPEVMMSDKVFTDATQRLLGVWIDIPPMGCGAPRLVVPTPTGRELERLCERIYNEPNSDQGLKLYPSERFCSQDEVHGYIVIQYRDNSHVNAYDVGYRAIYLPLHIYADYVYRNHHVTDMSTLAHLFARYESTHQIGKVMLLVTRPDQVMYVPYTEETIGIRTPDNTPSSQASMAWVNLMIKDQLRLPLEFAILEDQVGLRIKEL